MTAITTYLALGVPLGLFVPVTASNKPSCNIRRAGRFFQMPLEPYEWWSSALDGITEDDLRAIAARHHDLDDFADNLAWFPESRLLLHGRDRRWMLSGLATSVLFRGGSGRATRSRIPLVSPSCRDRGFPLSRSMLWRTPSGVSVMARRPSRRSAGPLPIIFRWLSMMCGIGPLLLCPP